MLLNVQNRGNQQANKTIWKQCCILHGWSLDQKNRTLLWCILGVFGLLITHVY